MTERYATWHQLRDEHSLNPDLPIGEWRCSGCRESLAVAGGLRPESWARVRVDLRELPKRQDGMVAFGLPPRVMTGTQRPSPRPRYRDKARPVPIIVYCPRAGVCGIRQRIA